MLKINLEPEKQKIFNKYGLHLNPFVFLVSAGIILLFVLFGILKPEIAGRWALKIQDLLVTYLGWLYILAVGFFLFFVFWLLLSPYGKIKLGSKDQKPEFGYFSWFAMLFSAGMGIGLVFYSVAEPLLHYANPPRSEAYTIDAAREAMSIAFFHWGMHAWAIYIVMGLSLAYFSHRKGMPLSLRSAFYPILGNKVNGILGDLIDTFAVFGTLFGIATSLGLGVQQVNSGLEYAGFLTKSPPDAIASQNPTLYILITCITLIATLSVVSGLDKGIRLLSNLNILLGSLLLLFVFFYSPNTMFLLKSFIQNTGDYFQRLITMTFWNAAYQQNSNWQKNWTLFYWAWWISWAPFVGIFVARISKGRTIREFILGVLFAPTLLTFFWLTVFGNTALYMELFGNIALSEIVKADIPSALYAMLAHLPLASITSLIGTLVVASYFVTSSDSGSLVIDILTSGGHNDPPMIQRIFWALLEGAVAAVLLYAGGLEALQTASITTALPMIIILVCMCWGLVKTLRKEHITTD